MALRNFYRVWCEDDGKWEYVQGIIEPTECPVDPLHIINTDMTSVAYQESISSVFGTNKYSISLEDESSTTQPTYTNLLTLSTGILEPGEYRVEWYYELNATTNKKSYIKIDIDSTDVIHEKVGTTMSHTHWEPVSGYKIATLTEVAHNINLSRKTVNNGTVSMRKARLVIWRIN